LLPRPRRQTIFQSRRSPRLQGLLDRRQHAGCLLRGKVLRHDRERTIEASGQTAEVLELGRPGHPVGPQIPRPNTDLTSVERGSKCVEVGGALGRGGAGTATLLLRIGHFHIRAATGSVLHGTATHLVVYNGASVRPRRAKRVVPAGSVRASDGS